MVVLVQGLHYTWKRGSPKQSSATGTCLLLPSPHTVFWLWASWGQKMLHQICLLKLLARSTSLADHWCKPAQQGGIFTLLNSWDCDTQLHPHPSIMNSRTGGEKAESNVCGSQWSKAERYGWEWSQLPHQVGFFWAVRHQSAPSHSHPGEAKAFSAGWVAKKDSET